MSKPKRILIVEDEQVLQEVYEMVLTSRGYEVYTASNGLEGLEKVKQVQPDLILLDIFMPVMDGREFMRNFDVDEHPATKIIVYTNLSDRATEKEMLELGADAVILKSSMTPGDLLAIVAKHLAD